MQLVSPLFTVMQATGFVGYLIAVAGLCVLLRRESQQQQGIAQDPEPHKAAWAHTIPQAVHSSNGVRLRWLLECGLIVQCFIALVFFVDPLSVYDLYPSVLSIWLNFLFGASLYANLNLFASWYVALRTGILCCKLLVLNMRFG